MTATKSQAAESAQTQREVRDAAKSVEGTAEDVKRSAISIEKSAGSIEETSDRNTQLAADRTVLAAERTYAAWIRTGLAALASGVGARSFLIDVSPYPVVMFAGTILIAFSIVCFSAAVWRELFPVDPPKPTARRLPVWLLAIVNGSLVLVSLSALVGIWLRR